MTREPHKIAGSANLWGLRGDQINLTSLPYQTVIQGWDSDIFAVKLLDGWYGPAGYGIFGSNDLEVVEAFENDPLCEGARVAFNPQTSTPKGVWKAQSPEGVEELIQDLGLIEFSNGTMVDFTDFIGRPISVADTFRSSNGSLVLHYRSMWWSFQEGPLLGGLDALSELLGLDLGDDNVWSRIGSLPFPIRIELF